MFCPHMHQDRIVDDNTGNFVIVCVDCDKTLSSGWQSVTGWIQTGQNKEQ